MLTDLATLQSLLKSAIEVEDACAGNIQAYHRHTRTLTIVCQRGLTRDFLEHFAVVTLGDGSACSQAMMDRRRVVICDMATDAQFEAHWPVAKAAGLRSVQSTPLCSTSTGELIGIMSTHFSRPLHLSRSSQEQLDSIARSAAQLFELHA